MFQSLAGCNSTNSSSFLSVTVSRSNFPIITNDTHAQSTFICMHDVSVCIFGTKTTFFAIKKESSSEVLVDQFCLCNRSRN